MDATGILMNCATLATHIFSIIVSFTILILVIYRLYFNNLYRRTVDLRVSSSTFDDNVSLILIGNTYLILVLYSATWISLTFRTFAGDFSLLNNSLHLGDSMVCRVQVGIIFFLTSALYHSFCIHALSRFVNVIFISRLNTMKICKISLNGIQFYILLIIFSWLVSFLVLIPAYTTLNAFSYFPEQYHCMISFSNIKGFIYSLLVCYFIPVCTVLYMYFRVIFHVRRLPERGISWPSIRKLTVMQHIFKTCFLFGTLGLPTLVFLFQFIIIGETYSITDRFHELCLALNTIGFSIGFAVLNSLLHILPQIPAAHERRNMIHLHELTS
jgi:hypothetical protein